MWGIEELAPGRLTLRVPFRPSMLRPGNVLSGPALFTAADIAMYALVLAHAGPALMAVTADFNIRFLTKAAPGDILAEASFLKFGRRLAVIEIALRTSAAADTLVAHATGTYALPAAPAAAASPAT
jgi:uncharacterized protein (TIGR00369 family)